MFSERRQKDLVIVAGPSCVGKTHFIQSIKANDHPYLTKQLGITQHRTRQTVGYTDLKKNPDQFTEKLFLHIAFWLSRSDYKGINELEVVRKADKITFITLWAQQKVLLKRLTQRYLQWKGYGNLILSPKKLFQHQFRSIKRRLIYQDASKLGNTYRAWFDFCENFNTSVHWLVEVTNNQPILFDLNSTATLNTPQRKVHYGTANPAGNLPKKHLVSGSGSSLTLKKIESLHKSINVEEIHD